MNAVPKKKLCWNCEGNVAPVMDNCPYCGVYVNATEEVEEDSWNPPYKLRTVSQEAEEEIPPAPYASQEGEEAEKEESTTEPLADSEFSQDLKQEVLPLLFFLSATIFFVFGLILLMFSHNGVLTLQWNGDLWPLFLFGSAPLFYFGTLCFRSSKQ